LPKPKPDEPVLVAESSSSSLSAEEVSELVGHILEKLDE
jgi:hypothetical protein